MANLFLACIFLYPYGFCLFIYFFSYIMTLPTEIRAMLVLEIKICQMPDNSNSLQKLEFPAKI